MLGLVLSPSAMVSTPSHFIPLPPEPVAVTLMVPPVIFILPSALNPHAAFVSRSSVSQSPSPVVVTSMVPPVIIMSPCALMPLAAVASAVMVSVPPSI